jgi:hypothetical protein
MRTILAALLIVLLSAPDLPARGNGDWENVKKLKPGTTVEVFLWSGDRLRGEIDSVSDAKLQIATMDRSAAQTNWRRDLDRTGVRKIVRFHYAQPLDPRKWMIGGAVAGGAVGLGTGVATDINQHQKYHWFEGALAGALLGFCAGLVALAVADGARLGRRRQVVYEDVGGPGKHRAGYSHGAIAISAAD